MKLLPDFIKSKFKIKNAGGFPAGIINKIIIILFITLAIGMTVISKMLNDKYYELKESNAQFRKTLSDAINEINKSYGINQTPVLDTNDQVVAAFRQCSRQIVKMSSVKKNLASALAGIPESLGSPLKYKDNSFDSEESAIKNCNEITGYVNKIGVRDSQIIDSLNTISQSLIEDTGSQNSLNSKIDPANADFNNLFFISFNNKLTALKSNLSNANSSLKNKDAQIAGLQDKLNKNSNTAKTLKDKIDLIQTAFDDSNAKHESEKKELERQISEVKNKVRRADSPSSAIQIPPEERTVFPEYYRMLKGTVSDYSAKWGFIIINIGKNTKIKTLINGTEREISVPIPFDKELFIANGDSYVAKARVVKAYDSYSVANIIYPTAQEIKNGYNVFFPDQETTNTQQTK